MEMDSYSATARLACAVWRAAAIIGFAMLVGQHFNVEDHIG